MALYWHTVGRDGSLGAEECVDARVCDCCQTALALDRDGAPLAAWRDCGEQAELRDIAWARRGPEGWSEPALVHADGWELEGCPVNGPALVGGAQPALAWYTGARGATQVRFATMDSSGAGFGEPIQLAGAASFGRLDLVRLGEGDWLASWLELLEGSEAFWALARFPDSALVQARAVAAEVPSARSSGFLRMVRGADELLVAWTRPGPRGGIATARMRLAD